MRPATTRGEAWAIELERGTGRLMPSHGLVAFHHTRSEARRIRRDLTGWPKARVVRVKVRIEVVA